MGRNKKNHANYRIVCTVYGQQYAKKIAMTTTEGESKSRDYDELTCLALVDAISNFYPKPKNFLCWRGVAHVPRIWSCLRRKQCSCSHGVIIELLC